MPTINLRPIQTGDACYLQDHHNRPGECIITVAMSDGVWTQGDALVMLTEEAHRDDRIPYAVDPYSADAQAAAKWCAEQWHAVQADMPAAADRDNEGGDEADRYLECHILATWEV